MDVILECFFDKYIELERNTLHARYKRKAMVDYFSTLIEGCCRGEDAAPEKICREAIVGILRYHENCKANNGSVCQMGKDHNILYIGAKLCYDWQLKDTPTVAALLESIYSCEKTFERLWLGALFGTTAPHFIAGWKSDFANQEENIRAMVYFMDHANTACLEFVDPENQQKVTRFVDLPFESCPGMNAAKILISLAVPDKLFILLRFGASILSSEDSTCPMLEWLLDRLCECNKVYPFNFVSCLKLILRVIPAIRIQTCDRYTQTGNVQKLLFVQKYQELIEERIVPLNRCNVVPPELKHLCRCAVRKRLWEKCQLPGGIQQLPIPDRLRKYVDIFED